MQNLNPSSVESSSLFIERDSNTSLVKSAGRFFSGTLLSRLSGMLRDIYMAYAFGTQNNIAALLVAFRFAHLLRRLFGEGAMQTALIPYFEELRKDDRLKAGSFFQELTKKLSYFLLIIVALAMASLWGLLTWGEFSEGNRQIIWLTFLMMPSLFFICLFGINAALMQCEKKYFVSSVAPVAFNFFWILGIAYSSQYPSSSMTLLSLFIVGACMAQWMTSLPSRHSILKSLHTPTLWKVSKNYSKDVLKLCKPLALGMMGVAASQINNALDAVFARWASEDGPAILWYAIRFQQLPLALFGIAIASAILPPLARAGKAQNYQQFNEFLHFALKRTLALMLPITFGLFLLGDGCIKLIYGHGDFNDLSVINTTECLWGYTVGLIPMALVLILAPAFYAKGDYKTPSQAALGSVLLNALLNLLFIAGFNLGAVSVAIATSISAWVNFFWLMAYLENENFLFSKYFILNTLKITFACLLAGVMLVIFSLFFTHEFAALEILQNHIPVYPSSFIDQTISLGLKGLGFLFFLILIAKIFRIKDILEVVRIKEL